MVKKSTKSAAPAKKKSRVSCTAYPTISEIRVETPYSHSFKMAARKMQGHYEKGRGWTFDIEYLPELRKALSDIFDEDPFGELEAIAELEEMAASEGAVVDEDVAARLSKSVDGTISPEDILAATGGMFENAAWRRIDFAVDTKNPARTLKNWAESERGPHECESNHAKSMEGLLDRMDDPDLSERWDFLFKRKNGLEGLLVAAPSPTKEGVEAAFEPLLADKSSMDSIRIDREYNTMRLEAALELVENRYLREIGVYGTIPDPYYTEILEALVAEARERYEAHARKEYSRGRGDLHKDREPYEPLEYDR